jgi:DNA (cytosine-5)-methyltransferase 1
LLDLYCGAGGAGVGYYRAGFNVFGVDIKPQPRYPFPYAVGDALLLLRSLLDGDTVQFGPHRLRMSDIDAVHASPPCQRFTVMQSLARNVEAHGDFLTPTRALLEEWGGLWVIENVPGAPMRNYVRLCGSEFDLTAEDTDGEPLQLRRHRQFESNEVLMGAGGCQHREGVLTASVIGSGGGWRPEYRERLGGGYTPDRGVCAALMGVTWKMTAGELSEAIPPAYTQFIGEQLRAYVGVKEAS